jgi:uncharacterized membrane protein
MSTNAVAQPNPGPSADEEPDAADEIACDEADPVDEGGPLDEPTRSDPFVRGMSQAIGGPLGDHAVRPTRSRFGGPRFWTPARVVLALACLMLSLHWVQKSPCRDGAWGPDLPQYKHFCYTDVLGLYYTGGMAAGQIPYVQHKIEYPVLTGALIGVIAVPIHAYASGHPGFNQAERYYDVNALVLAALGVATVAMILALRRRRPWDAAMFALSPGLFMSATVNWDLLAVALSCFFLYFWAKRRPGWAGIMLGLATAAKFYPLLLVGALFALALRTRRWGELVSTISAGLVTWVVVNAPVALGYRDSWAEFWRLNSTRGIDWGTSWYIGEHFPLGGGRYGLAPFQRLGLETGHGRLNMLYLLLFVLACAGILWLAIAAPRRPRVAQLAFLIVAVFLVVGKVWSQQYVLWLLPLAILARPRWGAFLAWQLAEIGYFVAFYAQLMDASGRTVFPEWVFVLASALRLITVCVLIGYVVRDILHPERDPVRRTYSDDPDGGPFNGAPDNRFRGAAADRVPAEADLAGSVVA